MSLSSRPIAMIALLLGVIDLAILDLWLAPEVLGEKKTTITIASSRIGHEPPPKTVSPPATIAVHPEKRPAIPLPATTAHDAAPVAPTAADAAVPPPPVDAGTPPQPADAGLAADARAQAVGEAAGSNDFKPEMFDLHFQQDRATIKSYHQQSMDEALALLQRHPQAVAVIEGYADASETRYGINALIKRRIGKIEQYLTKNGIAAERIRTVNRGSFDSADETESHRNRRARIRVELP